MVSHVENGSGGVVSDSSGNGGNGGEAQFSVGARDTREDGRYHCEGRLPPPRTLAEFLPIDPGGNGDEPPVVDRREETEEYTFTTAIAKCPICGCFEGDEVAVSHHVESVHFS